MPVQQVKLALVLKFPQRDREVALSLCNVREMKLGLLHKQSFQLKVARSLKRGSDTLCQSREKATKLALCSEFCMEKHWSKDTNFVISKFGNLPWGMVITVNNTALYTWKLLRGYILNIITKILVIMWGDGDVGNATMVITSQYKGH